MKTGLKLIVQIPAYNEEESIGDVIRSIPRKIKGISEVRILIIDDGSSDKTVENSKNAGADYIISNGSNKGLAFSFQRGLNEALKLGADIIVNTDADNQYNQNEISKIIKPVLDGKADIVSGDRGVKNLDHMIWIKKRANLVSTSIIASASGQNIQDASSGFRAFSKEAALRLFVLSNHTYTHETLIQGVQKKLRVLEVPIEFKRREKGESRLITSKWMHTKRSLSTIFRTTLMYRPLEAFTKFGLFLIVLGLIPYFRWIWFMYFGPGGDHIQSLLGGVVLMFFGGFSLIIGLLADLTSINRRYLEEILYRARKAELNEE